MHTKTLLVAAALFAAPFALANPHQKTHLSKRNFYCNGVDEEQICPTGQIVPQNQYACDQIASHNRQADVIYPDNEPHFDCHFTTGGGGDDTSSTSAPPPGPTTTTPPADNGPPPPPPTSTTSSIAPSDTSSSTSGNEGKSAVHGGGSGSGFTLNCHFKDGDMSSGKVECSFTGAGAS